MSTRHSRAWWAGRARRSWDAPADLRLLEEAGTGSRPKTWFRSARASGETRRVLMDSTVVLDAHEPQVITTFVDVTELERAEDGAQSVRRSHRRLHTMVTPLANGSGL